MSEGLVQTKSSQLRKSTDFQEVVFTSYKGKGKDAGSSSSDSKTDAVPSQLLVEKERFLKKTRHEIIKLGISGFDPTKRELNKQQLAISLGAKPWKKKAMNYKELKEMRAKAKREEKADKTVSNSLGKSSTGQALAKIKTRMKLHKQAPRGDGDKGGSILSSYGKVNKNAIQKKKKKWCQVFHINNFLMFIDYLNSYSQQFWVIALLVPEKNTANCILLCQ